MSHNVLQKTVKDLIKDGNQWIALDNEIFKVKEGDVILIESPQYENHQWEVYPFLFSCDIREIKLNWENSDSKWINVNELNNFETVPSLDKVLTRLF